MNRIYWLASYPKSGNTWVRVFLTNYLNENDQPADINHLKGGPIASDRDIFDRWAGVEASDLPFEEIANLRPDVYRQMSLHVDHPMYVKVHDACTRNAEGQWLFPADVTGGVLYMIRNPLDVSASYAHHAGRTLRQTVDTLCDPTGDVYEMPDRISLQLPQRLMSWGDHVRSWVDDSGLRVTVIRYEDLHAQPGTAFSEVLRALDLEIDPRRLSKAISHSEFETMQEQEKRDGFKERHMRADAPFFRRGRVGAWREELAPDLVDRIIATQGGVMRRFGYLDSEDRPVF